jgi:SAM-dependent methyltransferase
MMDDPFFEPYDRSNIAYGDLPTHGVQSIIELTPPDGAPRRALDLGAGAGRDTLALAEAGYDVISIDLSSRGLERVRQRAEQTNVRQRVTTIVSDVREFQIEPEQFDVIVGTTVLDHIPRPDAERLWRSMTNGLTANGLLSIEVHSTEDPGCSVPPGCNSTAPKSETADAVVNYFPPSQLARWATDPKSRLRILRYEERLEWDYTHGPEHLHGKTVLLATRLGALPNWYGQPPAFPKREN